MTASKKPIQYRLYIEVNDVLVIEKIYVSDVYYNKQRSTYRMLLSNINEACDNAYLETDQARYFSSVKIFTP